MSNLKPMHLDVPASSAPVSLKKMVTNNDVPEALQQTLNQVAAQLSDRKNEVVDLLSNEQPRKSRQVEQSYLQCTWWEGCYYCQDEHHQWHRIKCFA